MKRAKRSFDLASGESKAAIVENQHFHHVLIVFLFHHHQILTLIIQDSQFMAISSCPFYFFNYPGLPGTVGTLLLPLASYTLELYHHRVASISRWSYEL